MNPHRPKESLISYSRWPSRLPAWRGEIDQQVCALYGLMPEKAKIMEGDTK